MHFRFITPQLLRLHLPLQSDSSVIKSASLTDVHQECTFFWAKFEGIYSKHKQGTFENGCLYVDFNVVMCRGIRVYCLCIFQSGQLCLCDRHLIILLSRFCFCKQSIFSLTTSIRLQTFFNDRYIIFERKKCKKSPQMLQSFSTF